MASQKKETSRQQAKVKTEKAGEIAAIGKRIKQVRTHLRIPQKEMAQKIGITSPHLSEIEKGKSSPSLEVVVKITKIFNMSLEYLFFDRGQMLYSDANSENKKFTFDSSVTSVEKLIWMLKRSDYFAILMMGAAAKIMLQEFDFIMATVTEDRKNED